MNKLSHVLNMADGVSTPKKVYDRNLILLTWQMGSQLPRKFTIEIQFAGFVAVLTNVVTCYGYSARAVLRRIFAKKCRKPVAFRLLRMITRRS